MEPEKDDQQTDHGSSESQQSQETRPVSKLRDLRPEKDPMGAGKPPVESEPSGSP